MRAFALAFLLGCGLAACTMPGAPDDATRLETGAGERAREADAAGTSGDAATAGDAAQDRPAQGVKPGAANDSGDPLPGNEPAPPMSDPLPPERVPDAAASAPGALDRSCRTSADCAVKNVGSCCGAMPACVNANARPDPAAVQAQCARQGMSSVCGFKEVTACACVAGTCEDAAGAVTR